jgi:iron(III) transport system permease protein
MDSKGLPLAEFEAEPQPSFPCLSSLRARSRPPLALLLAGASGSLLVLLPLAWTVAQACGADALDARDMLLRPMVAELLLNTLGLVLAATACAGLVGTACAWCIERTRLPGRATWAVLAAVPLAIPPFITSYAWLSIVPSLQGFGGALLVVTCAYTPFVTLPVAASLRGMDPALEETARSLGHGPWRTFRRVVLPQLRPALLGGMLLVALNTLVEFGAFTLLRFRTFTTELYAEYRTGLDGPDSALLAVVLIALCVACLAIESRIRGRARYARIARFTGRRATPVPLGWRAGPVLAGFATLAAVTIAVPLCTILFWLTRHNSAAVSTVAASGPLLLDATLSSVCLGLAGAALTMALAVPLGVLTVRYDGRLIALLERAAWLAQGVPGIVVALALVSLTLQAAPPLYQTPALLVAAYAILFLPLALVSVRAALAQAQRGLEEAGRSLGLGWAATAWRVMLPVAGPGLGAAAALVFVSVMTELTATLLLSPIGTETLATRVWADTSTLAFAAAAPYAALMAGLSLVSTWVLARRFGATALAGG